MFEILLLCIKPMLYGNFARLNFSSANKIVYDFAGVKTVTNSFADECFGKLVGSFDPHIKSKVIFENTSPFIKNVFLDAFHETFGSYGIISVRWKLFLSFSDSIYEYECSPIVG